MIIKMALKSLKNRWATSVLSVVSIALGVALFLGIERVRLGVRESFSSSISQTDLIVGARGGSLPLVLYTVFRIGNATNNISYSSFLNFKNHPAVEWVIPYSLGDSHRGFRVVATDASFYEHYRFRGNSKIEFAEGASPQGIWDLVLGSQVAQTLGYSVGSSVVLAHGISEEASIFEHDDKPFKVVGILKPTSTPIDRSLYIGLEGMEAIHSDWQDGAPPAKAKAQKISNAKKFEIHQLTSFLLRAKTRIDSLRLQREILDYPKEPLMAIIPGVAMAELWSGIGYAETALQIVSSFVILVGILGLLTNLLTSLDQRRREMAILRVLGLGRRRMLGLMMVETFILTVAGIAVGIFVSYASLWGAQNWIQESFGFFLPVGPLAKNEIWYLLGLVTLGTVVSGIPAWRAYRGSLADGLQLKI